MPNPGGTFTISGTFGSTLTSTVQGGTITVLPPPTGNNPQNISQSAPHNTNTTVWTGNAAYTDLQPMTGNGGGFGVAMTVSALNANANTPTCTILFKNGTSTALSLTLTQAAPWFATPNPAAQSLWINTGTNTVTSIVAVGDPVSDLQINGVLNFNT